VIELENSRFDTELERIGLSLVEEGGGKRKGVGSTWSGLKELAEKRLLKKIMN